MILDLDETLIYATEKALAREADFCAEQYFVYKRPHIENFLNFCFERFDVAVWTTSTAYYAETMVKEFFNDSQMPLFVWARDKCTLTYDPERQESYYGKKISKLRRKGYKLESIVVVDDSPDVWLSSYGNLVRVSRFEGDENDIELKILPAYLETLRDVPDVRTIEKRNWRAKIYF